MRLVVEPDPGAAAHGAAVEVSSRLDHGHRIGVATGNTFTPVYRDLARLVTAPAELELFLLDEYLGLAPDDPRSFRRTIETRLCEPLAVPSDRLHGPATDGTPASLALACQQYDARVGVSDLTLLGIGSNGHIAFNEPGAPFDSLTRVVTLSEETRRANRSAFAGRAVPRRAVTQGIGTILRARAILLVATGAHKARALAAALEEPPGAHVPASALQLHPDLTVIADRDAAHLLRHH